MPETTTTDDKLIRRGKRLTHIITLVLAGILLFMAQSSLWVNNVIFDQDTFTDISTSVVLSQESRDSISQAIVDEAFKDRPVADRLLGDRAVSFISGLLGSDISERALTKVASSSYAYMTSPDRQDIAIDLSAIREPLSGIISFAESRGREVKFDPSSIPERVVFVESDELPDIYSYIRWMILANLILWVSAVTLFVVYVLWNKSDRIKRLYHVGAAILVSSILGIAAGPFIPPVIESFVANINLRGLVGDLSAAYLAPFTRQLYLTILLTVLALLVLRFRWIITHSWDSAYQAVTSRVKTGSTPSQVSKQPAKTSKPNKKTKK